MLKRKFFKSIGVAFTLGITLFAAPFYKTAMAAGIEDAKTYTDGSKFKVDENGIITSYVGEDEEVVIPKELVTEAGVTVEVKGISGAFKDNTTVKNIIIPNTVASFGDYTFSGCSALSSIDIYNPAVFVDTSEFNEYTDYRPYIYDAATGNLYDIIDEGNVAVIPAALVGIGYCTFNECSFAGFYVIEDNAYFKDSDEIVSTDADGNEKKAGASLLSIDGKILYKYANGYRPYTYTMPAGVEEVKPYAFYKVSNGNTQEVIVANSVRQIDEYGFYSNDILKISFEENSVCESIGAYAFASCPNLEIKLPPSVKTVKSYALAYIINRTPDISETCIETMEPYIFYGCTNLHVLSLPKTLKELEAYAFAGCDNLNEVIFLGDTLDKIGTGAFKDCPNLHKINIPEGVKNLEDDTFNGCQNLNEIILPDSLEKIGDGAFADCRNIHVLVIPENVKYIANTSFEGANTESIDTSKNTYAKERMNQFDVGKFTYVIETAAKEGVPGTVYVKGISNAKYKNATSLSIPATVKFGDNTYTVISIKDKAFKGMKKLKSVKIGAETIGTGAFMSCPVLSKVTLTADVKTVGKSAFAGCKKLKTVKLGKNVTSIGAAAFKNCKVLAKVSIPASVTNIDNNAFAGCAKLKTVSLGKNVTSIGAGAFKNCKVLAKISIPANVSKIGNNAFAGCKKLKSVVVKSKKLNSKGLGKSAFKGIPSSAKVKVPSAKLKTYKKLFKQKGLAKKAKISK